MFAENTILYLCDILEHSLNPFRRFSIIFLCQSGLEETGRTAAAGKSPVKRAMNRGLKMIEEIGSVVGGEHYLAAMLILIFSCILTSRSILSERVNQGSFRMKWSIPGHTWPLNRPGPGYQPADDNEPHIALDNIRERLKLICNGELAISSRDCGGTVVTIRIPLKAES